MNMLFYFSLYGWMWFGYLNNIIYECLNILCKLKKVGEIIIWDGV